MLVLLSIVFYHRRRLLVVRVESLSQSLNIVVGALDQWLSGLIVGHWLLWWVELLVIRSARSWVYQSTRDTRNEKLISDSELNGVINGLLLSLEHVVELLSLGDGARETVEDETKKRISVNDAS